MEVYNDDENRLYYIPDIESPLELKFEDTVVYVLNPDGTVIEKNSIAKEEVAKILDIPSDKVLGVYLNTMCSQIQITNRLVKGRSYEVQ